MMGRTEFKRPNRDGRPASGSPAGTAGIAGGIGRRGIARIATVLAASALLAGCTEGGGLNILKGGTKAEAKTSASSGAVRLVERDVEAPEVFQVEESGLWDGRPSLGGVWVAHPDTQDPERVIIRNTANGKFVIGALFRRERDNPGPRLQISSDAAAAIGVLPGQPTKLNVTALRKEEVPDEAPVAVLAPAKVEATPLAPLAAASAAIDKAPATAGATASAAPSAAPAATEPAPTRKSDLDKPYIQIGFYSVEANATASGNALRKAGIVPVIRKQSTAGKTFWRVLVGPATSSAERAQLLKAVKGQGYADAYLVKN